MNALNQTVLLAIDDEALPVREHLCHYLSRPTLRAEPVLAPSPPGSPAPDEAAALFYGTVLHDEGRFRMWYYPAYHGVNPDWPQDMMRQLANYKSSLFTGPVCYAESDDGLVWSKPPLDQVRFKGSSRNNAIALPHVLTAGAAVIKDADDPDPARRYKMIYEFFPRYSNPPVAEWGRISTIATAVSPDGLRWTLDSIPCRDEFFEPSSLYRHAGLYIVGGQVCSWRSCFSEGGAPAGRTGVVRFSHDFRRWVPGSAEAFALPEPRDPAARGEKGDYDQVHLGVAPVSMGNVCVGLYGLWHNRAKFTEDSCDLGLVVSNDGLRFREPVKGHVFIAAADSPTPSSNSRHYNTNLCQGNGILNVGDETRIYYGRWRNVGEEHLEDYYGDTALATLPRDRWGALGLFPGRDEGHVWSAPIRISSGAIRARLNADAAECMALEIADEHGIPLPDFSGENAAHARGGGFDLEPLWPRGAPHDLAGRTVRLGVRFRRRGESSPRLYAVYLES